MIDFNLMLDDLVCLTKKAGEAVLEIYNSDVFDVEFKSDQSPLTKADLIANEIITKGLEKYKFPILSEESKEIAYEERKDWKGFWCVDPIDGTKEFIKKTGEFTINIAFVENNKPAFGIVYVPVQNKMYIGGQGVFPYCLEGNEKILLKNKSENNLDKDIVVASKSHTNKETEAFIQNLGDNVDLISMGSSLKFMLIAEGKASVYPRFVPTMEWDTAASHAILNTLGYVVKNVNGVELVYNKENLLNPSFIAN